MLGYLLIMWYINFSKPCWISRQPKHVMDLHTSSIMTALYICAFHAEITLFFAGYRPMNNPSQGHLDISSSEDEQSCEWLLHITSYCCTLIRKKRFDTKVRNLFLYLLAPSASTAISQVPNQGEQEEDSMIGDSGASAVDESNLQSSENNSSVAAKACKRPPGMVCLLLWKIKCH